MTLKQALEKFVETHAGDYEQKYVIDYVLGLAPHLSPEGIHIRLLRFTTNVNRKPWGGPRGYEGRGYNLLYLNRNGLYMRYIKGNHPEPVVK
jgi:hypothetical protein